MIPYSPLSNPTHPGAVPWSCTTLRKDSSATVVLVSALVEVTDTAMCWPTTNSSPHHPASPQNQTSTLDSHTAASSVAVTDSTVLKKLIQNSRLLQLEIHQAYSQCSRLLFDGGVLCSSPPPEPPWCPDGPGPGYRRRICPCNSVDSGESKLNDFMRRLSFCRRGEWGAACGIINKKIQLVKAYTTHIKRNNCVLLKCSKASSCIYLLLLFYSKKWWWDYIFHR